MSSGTGIPKSHLSRISPFTSVHSSQPTNERTHSHVRVDWQGGGMSSQLNDDDDGPLAFSTSKHACFSRWHAWLPQENAPGGSAQSPPMATSVPAWFAAHSLS